jgi:hypothetical protein
VPAGRVDEVRETLVLAAVPGDADQLGGDVRAGQQGVHRGLDVGQLVRRQ